MTPRRSGVEKKQPQQIFLEQASQQSWTAYRLICLRNLSDTQKILVRYQWVTQRLWLDYGRD
jgi:hypothetical protein